MNVGRQQLEAQTVIEGPGLPQGAEEKDLGLENKGAQYITHDGDYLGLEVEDVIEIENFLAGCCWEAPARPDGVKGTWADMSEGEMESAEAGAHEIEDEHDRLDAEKVESDILGSIAADVSEDMEDKFFRCGAAEYVEDETTTEETLGEFQQERAGKEGPMLFTGEPFCSASLHGGPEDGSAECEVADQLPCTPVPLPPEKLEFGFRKYLELEAQQHGGRVPDGLATLEEGALLQLIGCYQSWQRQGWTFRKALFSQQLIEVLAWQSKQVERLRNQWSQGRSKARKVTL